MAVRRARPEQQLQKAVRDHLRWRAAPGTFAFHCPNGGARSPIEARIFKSQGVVAGVPDVIILHDGKTYGLELKAAGGRLSPAQRGCHAQRRAAGAEVATAVGIDAALAQLAEWRLFK
jgi:hypothetical protein